MQSQQVEKKTILQFLYQSQKKKKKKKKTLDLIQTDVVGKLKTLYNGF